MSGRKSATPCLIVFFLFLAFFPHFLTSQHHTAHTIPHAFISVSFGFSVFFHAHTRTSARATDRDLASGLSKSVCVNTRNNREICLKRSKSGETLAKARFDIDGQIVRLGQDGERLIEPKRSWFPPKFPSFSGKNK